MIIFSLNKEISHATIGDFDEDRINLDGFVDHVSAAEASSVYELKQIIMIYLKKIISIGINDFRCFYCLIIV